MVRPYAALWFRVLPPFSCQIALSSSSLRSALTASFRFSRRGCRCMCGCCFICPTSFLRILGASNGSNFTGFESALNHQCLNRITLCSQRVRWCGAGSISACSICSFFSLFGGVRNCLASGQLYPSLAIASLPYQRKINLRLRFFAHRAVEQTYHVTVLVGKSCIVVSSLIKSFLCTLMVFASFLPFLPL